jgi:hypothetical protein
MYLMFREVGQCQTVGLGSKRCSRKHRFTKLQEVLFIGKVNVLPAQWVRSITGNALERKPVVRSIVDGMIECT